MQNLIFLLGSAGTFLTLLALDVLTLFLPFSVGGVVGSFSLKNPPTVFIYILGDVFFFYLNLIFILAICGLAAAMVAPAALLTLTPRGGKTAFAVASAALWASFFFRLGVGVVYLYFLRVSTLKALWGGAMGL
jgi:hypothetical protein